MGDATVEVVVVVVDGASAVVVVLAGSGTVVVVVVVVVVLVVVVEVVVVELVVVEVTLVVVAGTAVVVGLGCPYDQTYSGPGSPVRQLRQSAHVGQYPAARWASGCSIAHCSVLDAQQVNV